MNYPYGAVQNHEALRFLIAQQTPLFVVHGLGECSYLTEIGCGVSIEDERLENLKTTITKLNTRGGKSYCDYVCLADVNIDENCNNHFMFHEKEDAEAYLKWAMDHTNTPEPDPFWDDYDDYYDPYDPGYD